MARRFLGAACAAAALDSADGQLAGSQSKEKHPALRTYRCEASGCCNDEAMITLDANWRWVHNKGGGENCYADSWASEFCPDGDTCAQGCEVEGEGVPEYSKKYGITTSDSSLSLQYVTKHEWGENVGSRVYVMQGDAYKIYKLKNRELSFDVDLSTLGCGINGALYLVGMAEDGELGQGENKAGAHYGLGYCDSSCAMGLKWLGGTANVPEGSVGVCCTEVDLWEANRHSPSFAMHMCGETRPEKCETSECASHCDANGCAYNTYRLGDKYFMGQGGQYKIDTTRPFSVTTQFVTVDGTDKGALSRIERTYSQGGVTIQNAIPANLPGVDDGSMSDNFCKRESESRGDSDDFQSRGGMEELGKALDRGMVLVMSIWDDPASDMDWLDGESTGSGDCATGQGSQARETNPNATVHFSNIRVGAMGATVRALTGDVCHGVPKNVYEPDVGSPPAPSATSQAAKGASDTAAAEPSSPDGNKKYQPASTSTSTTQAGPSTSKEERIKGETAGSSTSADGGSLPESSSTEVYQIGGYQFGEVTAPPILTASTTPGSSSSEGYQPPPAAKYADVGRISVGLLLPGAGALGLAATGSAVVGAAVWRARQRPPTSAEFANAVAEVMSDTDEDI